LGLGGGRPSLGVCKACPQNIHATVWPVITINGTPAKARKPGDGLPWGPPMWAELHARAAAYAGDAEAERKWLDEFTARVPCGDCLRHWKELVAKTPPDLSDAAAYRRWAVDAHNAVNVRLGRAVWTQQP
jgi:hypothetical protein